MAKRPGWENYFMGFALQAATRATCHKDYIPNGVGAVIVSNNQLSASGYNGSVRGMPHCDDVGHDERNGSCVRTIHAEMNALAQAASRGMPTEGAAIFSTSSPCWGCFRVLVNAGIKEFYYGSEYKTGGTLDEMPKILEIAGKLNLIIKHVKPEGE